MNTSLVAIPGLLLLLVGVVAYALQWRRRKAQADRALSWEVWYKPVSWQIDVKARPMEVGKDID